MEGAGCESEAARRTNGALEQARSVSAHTRWLTVRELSAQELSNPFSQARAVGWLSVKVLFVWRPCDYHGGANGADTCTCYMIQS